MMYETTIMGFNDYLDEHFKGADITGLYENYRFTTFGYNELTDHLTYCETVLEANKGRWNRDRYTIQTVSELRMVVEYLKRLRLEASIREADNALQALFEQGELQSYAYKVLLDHVDRIGKAAEAA